LEKSVLFIANTSWNLSNFRLNLMRNIRDEGYRVIAVAPRDNSTDSIIKEGFGFRELKYLKRKGSNPLSDLKLYLEIKKIIKELGPKFIFSYTIKPVIYTNLASIKKSTSISTITGLGYTFLNNNLTSKIARKLYKIALTKCDHIYFQNIDDRELFEKSKIIKQDKARIINGSGIDTDKFKPLENRKENSFFTFLFIGRLLKDKGIYELLEASSRLIEIDSGVKLKIIGPFDEDNPSSISKENFEMHTNSKNIEYLGYMNNVIHEIQKADCVVLPSYREGIPRVLLEAISVEKPIIATNVPGCRQVVDDGVNGYLVEVKSHEDLFLKMKMMIEFTEETRREMGKKGRKKAREVFDIKLINNHYLELMRNCDN